ncbi:MAG: FUN14 domain-containing protein [Epsilonproteobacteria bacterium]|nr:FUN14 domain-containing protein [Campylobacterota bacterium]
MTAPETTPNQTTTFIDQIKNFFQDFDLKQWAQDMGGSSAQAIEAAFYFGLSFATGFLFKKYFKSIFICLIVSIFLIKGMEYSGLLTVDWTALQANLGITSADNVNAMINNAFEWIKNNLLLFCSASIGFLLGYKLG